MKQYIGTKQVKAEPMTRTEAEKQLGRNLTSKGEYGEDGYLVEYEDGYKSWSPKEVFDKAYKPCEDFKDRLRIEFNELSERLNKLNIALQKDNFREKIGDYQYQLIIQQKVGMGIYINSLYARIVDIDSGSLCKSPSLSKSKAK